MKQYYDLYIGTYSEPILHGTGRVVEGKGDGIHFARFDAETGKIDIQSSVPAVNPSYLVVSEDRRFLYCVNETKKYQGMQGGSASAYTIDAPGQLTLLNTQSTKGEDPCHTSVDRAGNCVFVANFMTGSVCMFKVKEDGSLEAASSFFQHTGSGPDTLRQTGPHAHAAVLSPNGRYLIVPDLGIDQIVVYAFDAVAGTLTPAGALQLTPGDGPRHVAFHPQKKNLLYVINEISLTVGVFDFNEEDGSADLIQHIEIVKAKSPDAIGADIQITPDGRFLYASVRDNDIIAAYQIDAQSGKLSAPTIFDCGGKSPRSFAITPNGKFLVAGNQDTDNIVVFEIDPNTGSLKQVFDVFAPTPVCIKFV